MSCAPMTVVGGASVSLTGGVKEGTPSLAKPVDLGAVVEQGVVAEKAEGINVEASREKVTPSQ